MGNWIFKFLILFFVLVGCSQSVNKVSVTPKNPPVILPESYITTTDVQGGTSVTPASANRRMSIHSFGGSTLRTNSTSVSFRMTSGIGID